MIISETNPIAVKQAIKILKQGGIIAFATDTVYGVAADATNYAAVEKLYQLKKRDAQKPIAIFLPDIKSAQEIFSFDFTTKNIAEKYLPGKLTIVAKTSDHGRKILAKNLNQTDNNFIGFRVVDSFFIKNLFKEFSGILAVTSANPSTQEVAKNAAEIEKYFPHLDLIIDSKIDSKKASTVIKIIDNKIELIRAGALEIEELQS